MRPPSNRIKARPDKIRRFRRSGSMVVQFIMIPFRAENGRNAVLAVPVKIQRNELPRKPLKHSATEPQPKTLHRRGRKGAQRNAGKSESGGFSPDGNRRKPRRS